ncbi:MULTISPECIES: UDP-N-acetylmuramate dehydrogenase [unclassified Imperialibacter]|uniref:UDP-N-acetylmuramate dehydrogenase n=1 Tax=unclassified Imperialibacter TaxID=2629706 RepID=UPI001254E819|nr:MULTISPECIES: UDP-N-acetylmuramate dehydrogenase [unclassified Imperialibacter]CAD5257611.1 UDP-N-acetylenolpyruvoylglucosamine reductase [Imperialibacter sp. 89]CAD5272589.1 UDP-N-acetylenolpyruvoylglucosamine reductase [Imperialibacter sp. 75]VVT32259.1 UDP-N-acetylenolpyruvoylglucosamine reductase [Imperialibacter sp. EC-SDR9]
MKIEENKSLHPYHTFHLDIRVKYFTEAKSVDELKEIINSEIFKSNSHLILGGGSNVLFTKDFEGLVVKLSLPGVQVREESQDEVIIKVGAGVVWHELVMQCVAKGWGGIENLSLIPGTVGAAPMQNIGAYGVEIKDVFHSLEALEVESGKTRTFNNNECEFGYRESVFKKGLKDKFIITSVTFVLQKEAKVNTTYGAINETLASWNIEHPTIADVSRAVIHIRQSKLPNPDEIGNAGSFFKNPTISGETYERLRNEYSDMPGYPQEDGAMKVPAGWLIEKDGWKGKTIGQIGVHKNQALVLVNYGNGSGHDIWELAQQIQASVKKRFGIELSAEVNIV